MSIISSLCFYERKAKKILLYWYLNPLFNHFFTSLVDNKSNRGTIAHTFFAIVIARGFTDIRDFKIQDATASRTRWLINGLGLDRRRLSGKSKVKIPVWMQDNAAAKRSLSV